MKVSATFECEVPFREQVYLCNVRAISDCTYAPAKLSGPPEDCWPDESEQETTFEILDCTDGEQAITMTTSLQESLHNALPVAWMEAQLWSQFMAGDPER